MSTEIKKAIQSESTRIKQFRLEIAKKIPKFPNNKATLEILESKGLASLLIDYVNWAYRLIPPRPRKVSILPTLTGDRRWKPLGPDTKVLLERVRQGDDLSPNLSLRVFRNGFTPSSTNITPTKDRWEDKDFFLNTMGYHHLHLSQVIESAGHVKRTDDVLFAQVTKDSFHAIGFFNHSVFEISETVPLTMTVERERLWDIYEQRISVGRKPGEVYISTPIATSGHPIFHTRLADEFARIIHTLDSKLDDLSTRSEVFQNVPNEIVKAMKLKWHLNYLDLGLVDKSTSVFYVLRYGGIS